MLTSTQDSELPAVGKSSLKHIKIRKCFSEWRKVKTEINEAKQGNETPILRAFFFFLNLLSIYKKTFSLGISERTQWNIDEDWDGRLISKRWFLLLSLGSFSHYLYLGSVTVLHQIC